MIGKLKGIIDSVGDDYILLDVGGVCYEVSCSSRTLATMPGTGEPITLSIETYVREDQIRLFGFTSDTERTWFRLLQSVQGVGAKVALAILGTLPPSDLANAIALQDKAQVARSPGVGPKVAQRIVTELKGKGPALGTVATEVADAVGDAAQSGARSTISDAVSALTNLGYAGPDASVAVAEAMKQAGEDAKTEELIRLGLKELSK